ncbi:hypothetical protein BC834DRAFT_132137 [Gloeopeniophorella convolvens]|nr:hypothetical protein BC834DRAFT_132137 [Gloeopeniophorella convolvens]
MPLFGKKHNDKAPARQGAADFADTGTNNTGAGHASGPGTNGPGTNYDQRNDFNAPTAQGYDNNSNLAGRGAGQNFAPGPQGADPYNAQQPGVPPTSHVNQNTGHHSNPGTRAAGKVEHAVGTLVGSNALKARGAEKEQEANAFKDQSREIAEAERLEREAMIRRERAVAHGAHPDNRHLGGLGNNTTL